MVLDSTRHEAALRRLPLAYSLALRLRDAGTAPEVVCEYLGIEQDALPGLYRLAEEKLGGLLVHPQTTSAADDQPPQLGWQRTAMSLRDDEFVGCGGEPVDGGQERVGHDG